MRRPGAYLLLALWLFALPALAQPMRRIVSLAPHVTELLFAAGAGSSIVGVLEYSDYPPAAKQLERVGDNRALDLERIVALKPDLVIAWPYGYGRHWLRASGQRLENACSGNRSANLVCRGSGSATSGQSGRCGS